MASPQAFEKMSSRMFVKAYDFDPDGVDPVDVTWLDFQNYTHGMVIFFRTVGVGNLDGFRILANAQSNGGGTDVVVKQHAIAAQPNAVGDQIFLEFQAEEIMQEANDAGVDGARYISASAEFATATDEGVVIYIFSCGRFTYQDLTADFIS